jgi:ADP-ribosylglycohydrolase
VEPRASWPDFIRQARAAIVPYLEGVEHVADDAEQKTRGPSNAARPSRTAAIEELPIALGALRYGGSDFGKMLHAGVFYGRDCDSIGGMAAGLFGAIFGVQAIPPALRTVSDQANQRDLGKLAGDFAGVVRSILEKDAARLARRRQAATC